MKIRCFFMYASIISMILISCNQTKKESMNKENPVPAIDTSNMDKSVNPGDDFYTYVNGGWLKKHPLPADKSRYGAFDEIAETNKTRIKKIIENAMNSKSKKGSISQKIGDFYASGMDSAAVETAGIKPLQPEFDKIDALKDKKEFANLLAHFSENGIPSLFYIYSSQDKLNSKNVIANFWQGGLTLPDRDYYSSDDSRSKQIRKDYKVHLEKMYEIIGESKADAQKKSTNNYKYRNPISR